MTASRRPAAGRRPAASRGRAARTTRAPAARAAARASTGAPGVRRTGLTHRAAVLALVVTTLVLSAALPLREFLDQRSEIGELERSAADTRERVAELEEARRRLDDPAHIAAEARRRLHMARPGEVAYVLLTPPPAPEPEAAEQGTAAGPDAPWWSQVWSSVQAADRPPAPEAEQPPAQPAPPPPPAP